MEIKEYIKSRRIELGLSQLDVAKKVGVSEATVSRWESGDIANMGASRIKELADVLQTSPLEILGEQPLAKPDIFSIHGILPIETYKIPLLGSVSCGELKFANEDFEGYVECGANIQADFALRASGDSMVNARILDGDIVFVRKQSIVAHGEIAVVVVDDETTLKRFYQYGDTMVLKAENPAYNDIEIRMGEEHSIYILGKVIAFQSDVI